MKRKLFTLLLAVAASVGTIFAESGKCGKNLTWDLTDGVLTICGTGEMYNDYVTDVQPAPWYSLRGKISSVIICEGVSSISSWSFYEGKFTSVTLPKSLTRIGDGAFSDCSGLTSVTLPNNIISIGMRAFWNCSNLSSINIPISVMEFGVNMFNGCESLPVVDNIRYAGTYLVEAVDKGLTTYTIQPNTTWIGDSAFAECKKLKTIEIPDNVVEIGMGAFYLCKELPMSNNIRYAGACAVESSGDLSTYTIKEGTKWIGACLFCGHKNLTSITIPNGVKTIGRSAFQGCSKLSSVTIPNSVTRIARAAFAYLGSSCLTSVAIPEGVTRIGPYAFDGGKMERVDIPSTVKIVGARAFDQCYKLDTVSIKDVAAWCNIDFCGIYANPLWHARSLYLNDTLITDLIIPFGVVSISKYAFYACKSLTSIEIPNSVTSIGDQVFDGCHSLKSVTCCATTLPELGNSVWGTVNCSKIPLYVPAESVAAYKVADQWKEFSPIMPIAGEVEIEELVITPFENSVDIAWPRVDEAEIYEILIKDKKGNEVCTLILDADGRLLSIVYHAPVRSDAPQKTQKSGFLITVTGLEEGTSYDLTFTAKDSAGNTLSTQKVSFTTKGEAPQGIEDIHFDAPQSTKILLDGQIYILRGEHIFDAQGALVK